MRIAALAVMMTLSATSVQAKDARLYAVKNCGKFTVQMDLNKCAEDNYQSADKALNKIYQALMADQDDAPSKQRLKQSERAWIVYRDRECDFEVGPQETGGSIWPSEMSGCLEELTARRIRELKQAQDCTPLRCPSH
jgi:uncharacterized protein YecT (DUF1311 family)